MNRRRGGDTRTHTVSTLTRCVPAECLHFSIFFFSSYSASLRRSLVRYSSSLPSQIPSLLALVHPLSSFIRLLPSVPRCCLSLLPRYSVPETSFAASHRSYDDILSERYPHRQMSENYFWRHFWEPLSGLPDPRTAIYLQRHTRLCASLSCRADLGAATKGRKDLWHLLADTDWGQAEESPKCWNRMFFFLMHSQLEVSTEWYR